jgi:hypothetical protein
MSIDIQEFNSIFKEFCNDISKRYSLNKDDLWNLLEGNKNNEDASRGSSEQHKQSEKTDTFDGKCKQIIASGKNKGKICGAKSSLGQYCKRHGKMALDMANLSTLTGNIKVTKTQTQMIELLNSSVPKKQTVLKKCSKGLFDEESEFVFDNDFNVIGKYTCLDQNKRKLTKLNRVDIEKCEQQVWNYLNSAIEKD